MGLNVCFNFFLYFAFCYLLLLHSFLGFLFSLRIFWSFRFLKFCLFIFLLSLFVFLKLIYDIIVLLYQGTIGCPYEEVAVTTKICTNFIFLLFFKNFLFSIFFLLFFVFIMEI